MALQCLKCGKKIQGDQVFCPACLEEMDRFPVKPGTAVLLPDRKAYQEKKMTARRILPVTEQNRRLRRRSRWLATGLFFSLLALICTAIILVQVIREGQIRDPNIGQNYSAMDTKSN